MKLLTLKNNTLELSVVPEFGLHWISLKYFHNSEWLSLLYPVFNIDNLPQRPYHDGSYVLAPWSNRVEKAQFQFQGKSHQLKPNFPDGTAIHGDVWKRPWTVINSSENRIEAELDSGDFSDFNYPFHLKFNYQIILKGKVFEINFRTLNKGQQKAPVGFGFHPFWNRRLKLDGSDAELMVPASKIYPTKKGLPQGPADNVTPEYDLKKGKDLSGISLDDCFTGLSEQALTLTYKNPGVRIRYDFDDVLGHVVIYSPLDEKGKPREFVAVEPVSNVTNGFNLMEKGWSQTGVKILEPDEKWGGTWKLTFESLPS